MENLRRIRKAKGITMKQLGEMVSVSESMIGMVETGKRNPSFELLLKLGEALGCTVMDIIDGEKIPATENDDGNDNDLYSAIAHANERQRVLIKRILGFSDAQVDAFLSITQSSQTNQ